MEEKPITVNVFHLADALKAKPKPLKSAGKCGCLLLQCLKKKQKKHLTLCQHTCQYLLVWGFIWELWEMLPGVGAEIMKVLMSSLWSAWSMAALQQPHSIIRELKIIVSF